MKKLLRRSNLMAPVTSPELSSWLWWSRQDRKPDCEAWRHIPDAVTLDLEAGVLPSRKEEARGLVRQAIPMGRAGARWKCSSVPTWPTCRRTWMLRCGPGSAGSCCPWWRAQNR